MKNKAMQLSPRELEVLSTIIQDYIHQASPVGSRTVSKKSLLGLSPASIRNVMADLTDKGLLEQPHTSAGRIPTAMAFRLYVDRILHMQPLPPEEQESIAASLSDPNLDLPDILKRASKLLSSLSQQVSLVLAPHSKGSLWKRIDFVFIKPGLIMSILLLEEGLVQNKFIVVDKDFNADDLVKYGNYLNELFHGRTLAQVRTHLLLEMDQAHQEFNALFKKALQLARQAFLEESREMFVDGTANILDQPDFSDLSTLRELFKVIEERSCLLDLLDKAAGGRATRIVFGQDSALAEIPYCGLISSPYQAQGETLGALGVIGPMRMDYAKVVPVVDFTARMLTEILKKRT